MKDTTRTCLELFAAWAAHDAEELITMSRSSRRVLSRAPTWVPVPAQMRTHGISQAHANLSVGIMGALVAAASMSGVRTDGRSALFRGALLAFGVHGLTHIAGSVAVGGYTTGVATTPMIVLPYWLRARSALSQQGIHADDARSVAMAVAALPLMFMIHRGAWAILGERSIGFAGPDGTPVPRLAS